jgi:glucose/arabinose dehydrogenase
MTRTLLTLLLVAGLAAPAAGHECATSCCAGESCDCGCGCGCEESVAALPPGFVSELVAGDLPQATCLALAPSGPVLIGLKSGIVRVLADGQLLEEPLLDISDEVANFGDFGLLSVAVDPDFAVNGHVYLLYVVDHHHLAHFGTPQYDPGADEYGVDTLARVARYTADPASGFRTLLPGSRLVLLGESAGDGPVVRGTSHGPGMLLFGEDGSLLVSAGDAEAGPSSGTAVAEGLIPAKADVGAWRAQLVDALNGRILRLDPASGDGVASNPWFDPAAPRSGASRTWVLGLRNPCRFALLPGSGQPDPLDADPGTLLVGDVGAEAYEELDVAAEGGLNFGWPLHEGFAPYLAKPGPLNLDAPDLLSGAGGCAEPFLAFGDLFVEDSLGAPWWPHPCIPGGALRTHAPLHVHARPALEWRHVLEEARAPDYDAAGLAIAVPLGEPDCPVQGLPFAGNCSMAGAIAGAGSWPAPFGGSYYHADFGLGWIRRLDLDAGGHPLSVEPFAEPVGQIVALAAHPDDGALWYVDYGLTGNAHLHRIAWSGGNQPPVAVAAASPAFGPLPLQATFDAAGSADPEGGALQVRWDFSDGTPWSLLAATTRDLPAEDITALGTPISDMLGLDPPTSQGILGNPDMEVLRDGDRPAPGTLDEQRQYATIHFSDPTPVDYLGYSFGRQRTFTGVLLQEGIQYLGGGWFSSLAVQVRTPAGWVSVQGLTSAPPYPASAEISFETYELRFVPMAGDAIRVIGLPGGISAQKFVTVGELRVLARPLAEAPQNVSATLTVTDPAGATGVAQAAVSVGNTPPSLTLLAPLTGATFSTQVSTTLQPLAEARDAEDGRALAWTWQVILHHDNHTHPEAPVTDATPVIVLQPEGVCGTGDVYWIELRATVTDPLGLQATSAAWLVPDCDQNQNGLDDAAEIAAGTQPDADMDGVIDTCQTDCDGDGVPDFAAIHFGLAADADGDGLPDDCE